MARALPIPRTPTYIAAPAPTRLIRRPPTSPLMPSRTANPTRATAIAKNPIAITNTTAVCLVRRLQSHALSCLTEKYPKWDCPEGTQSWCVGPNRASCGNDPGAVPWPDPRDGQRSGCSYTSVGPRRLISVLRGRRVNSMNRATPAPDGLRPCFLCGSSPGSDTLAIVDVHEPSEQLLFVRPVGPPLSVVTHRESL